ncbi:YlxR family protein [Virgibacillus sp. MSJ-26]|uniref:RNase P modulator RnpM n=1 Tax=Virgibacillus sp. MSJ-26 TaxID=2841522 RepID=UPI001C11B624|nr:YlxR family protein [Virgibacillus sp. MSJ-26]MBU5466739.1 YlxR family protein [Virgibacillus sp. MSJ-26]
MVQKRKVPYRKCVITGQMKPKKELIRVVRNKEGDVFVDPTGKKNGRGAYLSMDLDTINKAEESEALNRQLNAKVDASVFEDLRELLKENQVDEG